MPPPCAPRWKAISATDTRGCRAMLPSGTPSRPNSRRYRTSKGGQPCGWPLAFAPALAILSAALPVCVAATSAHAQQHAEAVLLAFVEALVERLGGVGEFLQIGRA